MNSVLKFTGQQALQHISIHVSLQHISIHVGQPSYGAMEADTSASIAGLPYMYWLLHEMKIIFITFPFHFISM